ncbi:hypothetical protein FOL47_006824 [Perkinsus chesapeaki]|uniref:J domain-containing protein n=1 Tax=Perkinsus chesapeaki TaxID=330153 RepID=A0A7J6MX68_PERCH|nr:hypothetical protein FOL47_006824 [Perkinsus chesapeaki]
MSKAKLRGLNEKGDEGSEYSTTERISETERKAVWVRMTRERRKRVLAAKEVIVRGAMRDEQLDGDQIREWMESFSERPPLDLETSTRTSKSRRKMSNQTNSSVKNGASDSSFVAEADAGAGISSGTEALGGQSTGLDDDFSDSDGSDLGSFCLSEVEDIEYYYELLDIDHQSNHQEIRDAYRWLALHTHPDKCRRSSRNINYTERAVRVFQRVGEAYRTLSDPFRRWVYDEYGDHGIDVLEDGNEADVDELKERYDVYMKAKQPGRKHYQGRARRRRAGSRQAKTQGGFKKLAADACFAATETVTRYAGVAADGATSGAAQGARIGAYLAPLTFGLSLPTLSAVGSVIGAARASIGELRRD